MWFYPNSALTEEQFQSMPLEVARRTPEAFLRVIHSLANSPLPLPIQLDEVVFSAREQAAIATIGSMFSQNGSDKASVHNYHLLYGAILKGLNRSPRILEIGLGSNNPSIASNMGSTGRPGASLRAFRSYSPGAIVHGADIDETITVDGCKIFTIDQTNPSSFQAIRLEGESSYDLIIDDGLHSPDANLNTLQFALTMMSIDGSIVIEDISPSAVPVWDMLRYYFRGTGLNAYLFKASVSYVFLVTRSLRWAHL